MSSITIFTAPQGALIPDSAPFTIVTGANLTEKLVAANAVAVPFFITTTREIQALTEFSDVFGVDMIVVDHIPGAKFDTMYDAFSVTLAHTTLDTVQALVEKAKAKRQEDRDESASPTFDSVGDPDA